MWSYIPATDQGGERPNEVRGSSQPVYGILCHRTSTLKMADVGWQMQSGVDSQTTPVHVMGWLKAK